MAEPVGSLPEHPLEKWMMPPEARLTSPAKWKGKDCGAFLSMIENYIDDCVSLVQTTDMEVLRHAARAALYGIHSIFPPPHISGDSGEDPISLKKLINGDIIWAVRKEVLGWIMDGATRCIQFSEKKQEKILEEFLAVLCM